MTLPFVMPSPFNFQKRVLAHRVPSFGLSIGNQPAASDYYETQYLTVGGESNKHAAYGGFLRSRPLPVTPSVAPANYLLVNMEQEVHIAIAQGITGFIMDIQGIADGLSATGSLATMLQAAASVDPRFWVVPMFDMNALVGLTQTQAVQLLATYATQATWPNIARLPDGRMLFSAFDATLQPLSWWQAVIAAANLQGVDVAFIPVLLGDPATNPLAAVSHGYGQWGTATAAAAQARPPAMMMPILSQQFRPDDQVFWEAGNFDAYVASWMAAINANQPYVQIVTWNDFSESGQIQPFTDSSLALNIGTGYSDLCAYYATWFLSGVQPAISRDVVYWCYRKMSSTAAHPSQPDAFKIVAPGVETDNIEVLAFLTAPGTISIGETSLAAPAGITSLKVPVAPGQPVFALDRDGSDVFRATGPVTIYGPAGSPAGTLDMTYWSGSISN